MGIVSNPANAVLSAEVQEFEQVLRWESKSTVARLHKDANHDRASPRDHDFRSLRVVFQQHNCRLLQEPNLTVTKIQVQHTSQCVSHLELQGQAKLLEVHVLEALASTLCPQVIQDLGDFHG